MKWIVPIPFLFLASAYVTASCATLPNQMRATYARSGSTHVEAATNCAQAPPHGKTKDPPQDRRNDPPHKIRARRLCTGGPKIAAAIVDATKFPSSHKHCLFTSRVTHGISFLPTGDSSLMCDRAPPAV